MKNMHSLWKKIIAASSERYRPEQKIPDTDPNDVLDKYDEYVRSIQKALLRGFCLATILWVMFHVFVWVNKLGDTSEPGPVLVLRPLTTDVGIAGFSFLLGLAIALQVAVRGPGGTGAHHAARRMYLSFIANLLCPMSIGLGIYAVLPQLKNNSTVDFIALFGPLIVAGLIAIIAADASAATDSEIDSREHYEARRRRLRKELLNSLRSAKQTTTAPSGNQRGAQLLKLVGPALLLIVFSLFFTAELGLLRVLFLLLLQVLLALAVFALAAQCVQFVALRNWVSLTGLILGSVLLALFLSLTMVLALLESIHENGAETYEAGFALWVLCYVTMLSLCATYSALPGDSKLVGSL